MTNSHEPLAPTGAGDQPGEKVEAQAAGASAGSNGTGDINALNMAQEAAHSTSISASTQGSAERQSAGVDNAASTAADPVGNDFASDESADDRDDFDEDAFDDDEYEETQEPPRLSSLLSFLRWPPSRRALYVAGAVILVIALLLPATLVAFGARGAGPLAIHPTPTITPTATATPPQTVTVQDPLTKRSTRWPEEQDCSMRDDGYHITDNNICFLAGAPIKNSFITVTALQVAGVDDLSYGITLRRAAEGKYYSFEIDGSGRWYFYKAAVDSSGASVLTLLASHADNPSINKGLFHTNTLQVRATGSLFEFFVNNVKVGQANDSSYAAGAVGLGGNDQLEVVYTNFILTQSA
jgi:hypothetical protein